MDSASLARLAGTARAVPAIVDLFDADPDRGGRFFLEGAGIGFDFSRQLIDGALLDELISAAGSADIHGRFVAMFGGERVNVTEDRRVLHTASRSDDGGPVAVAASAELERALSLAVAVRADPTIDVVVNIGIGGSDLGPAMVVHALRSACDGPTVRFVSNIDPADLDSALDGLDPSRTVFVVASKTFTTLETMHNAERAREWVRTSGVDWTTRFVATTADPDAARAWGIAAERVLAFDESVGGRFSVSSVIGFPVMCAIGADGFRGFLDGMRAMDRVALDRPLADNLPVVHGLVWWMNSVLRELPTVAVVPYSHDLGRLPAFLQQLVMESNGKRVTATGSPVVGSTSPVVWGEPGTNGQHAFFQMLHQGTQVVPVEFVCSIEPVGSDATAHDHLLSNMLAQAEATLLAHPHAWDTPLGSLVAMYEHSTAVQGWMSDLNSFDQFGVELGKTLARATMDGLVTERPDPAQRTIRSLVSRIIERRSAR